MIVKPRGVPEDAVFEADICIIGAGAAGIAAAVELGRQGIKTLLIPGGDRRYSGRYQKLYRGSSNRNIPLERARQRRFGGTTAVWGGRCIPFDAIDFEERPYVPNSGWPLDYTHLAEYYHRAQEHLDIGSNPSYHVETALPDEPADMIEGFRDDVLLTNRVEKFSLPTNLGKKYQEEIEASDSITTIMDGHLVDLEFTQDGDNVSSIACVTGAGTRFTCRAKRFVLAMGTLETTRHLLRSRPLSPNGVGNGSDTLGRFFMTHFSGVIAEIAINADLQVINRYEIDRDGVYCRRRIQISEEAQSQAGILNFSSFLHHTPLEDPSHRDPVLSLIFLAKGLRGVAMRIPAEYSAWLAYGRFGWREYVAHAKNIVLGLPGLIRRAPELIQKRWLSSRKLPSLIIDGDHNRFALHYHVEQAPHEESRVTLLDELDEHGVPRLNVDLQYRDIDVESILKAHLIIKERLEHAGVGTLRFLSNDPRRHIEEQISFGGHQMGTTRMAETEKRGVVDLNCRVFGVDNLFIAAPSVFPTGGQANPVATIVACAIRLADHLVAN